jgi:hypothetical protein
LALICFLEVWNIACGHVTFYLFCVTLWFDIFLQWQRELLMNLRLWFLCIIYLWLRRDPMVWVLWWCLCAFEFRNKDIFERWVISAQLREYCVPWMCPLVYVTKHLSYLVCVCVHIFRCILIPLEYVYPFILYAWCNLRIAIWIIN